MKRNDYLDFWDKYGLLIATIGDISILAVCFMKPHWIIVSLFSILLFIASIGWSISISLHYIDEVEHKSSAISFFLGSNDSSITLGLYGCTILVPMIGLNLQPETILCICLPLISVFIGLTIGAFTIPRIYLSIKGYKLNKTLTVLMSLCTIVLLLPIIIPIYYIMISFLQMKKNRGYEENQPLISHWDREASGYDTKEAHRINIKSVGNIRDEKGGIVYNAIFNYYKYLQTVNKLMRK